jgi:DNA-binding NarL/FixJ family response regulator
METRTVLLKRPLTPRETVVFPLLLEDLSAKEIASRLNISSRTAKQYVIQICDKFCVCGRRELFQLLGHYEVVVRCKWLWHFDKKQIDSIKAGRRG